MSAAAPFRLASHLAAYPEQAFLARLQSGVEDCNAGEALAGGAAWRSLAALCMALGEAEIEDLRADYIDLFDRAADDNPLSETEYGGRGTAKGSELADIAGFYLAFGVRPLEGGGLIDHLAVELEFYGWLSAKEEQLRSQGDRAGIEVVRDGRRKFLGEHLGRFVAAVAARPGVAGHRFYGPALAWCADLVRRECAALAVAPPLAVHRRQPQADAVCCAGKKSGSGSSLPVL